MTTVGAYEAKTRLSELLERVARGESFTITRHGVPVATLAPVSGSRRRPASEVVAEMLAARRGVRLAGESIRELIEEGRRF
jgi:prevent-host-death family protein